MPEPLRWPFKPRTAVPGAPVSTTPKIEYSANWGPHLCPSCLGARWLRIPVDVGHPDFGKIITCTVCHGADFAEIEKCYRVSGIAIDGDPTFAAFDTHDAAAAAMLSAAKAFAGQYRTPDKRTWLTIHGAGQGRIDRGAGKWGAGKTHLALAVTYALLKARVPCLYLSATALFQYLGAVHRDDASGPDYEQRLRWVLDVPALVIDELNKESNSPAVERLRLAVLDGRYQAATAGYGGGGTFLVSNDDPSAWHDPAIASRARDRRFHVVAATDVDYRDVHPIGGAA